MICKNGCGDVYNSRELLEVLDNILGANNNSRPRNEPIEDTALMMRIERLAKRKLAQKGNYNAKVNPTR